MRLLAIAALTSVLLSSAAQSAPTFTTIDNAADPTFNQLLGIDNAGLISGYFGSSAVGHPNQGYSIAPPYTTFTPDNYPTSVQTQATGLNNNGAQTGFWSPTNLGGGDANYGFIRWNTKIKVPGSKALSFIAVNDPKTTSNPAVNQALGINDNNIAVGFYNDADGNPHGFAYTVSSGKYTPVNVPGAASDAATGINANNLVCGFFTDAAGNTGGFLKPLTGGNAVEFTVPKTKVTQFLGVNASGMAVGFFLKAKVPHGVLYNPGTGQWVQVDAPNGAQGTILNGINDNGDIVGFYMDSVGNTHGVLIQGE